MGDIPLNYQHGARDTGTPPGSAIPPTSVDDFVVRVNDPVMNPSLNDSTLASWFSTFPASGKTVPTTVAATTSPSPAYSTSLKHVYVPYSAYNHGELNAAGATFPPYGYNTPWWNWMMARARTDYP